MYEIAATCRTKLKNFADHPITQGIAYFALGQYNTYKWSVFPKIKAVHQLANIAFLAIGFKKGEEALRDGTSMTLLGAISFIEASAISWIESRQPSWFYDQTLPMATLFFSMNAGIHIRNAIYARHD